MCTTLTIQDGKDALDDLLAGAATLGEEGLCVEVNVLEAGRSGLDGAAWPFGQKALSLHGENDEIRGGSPTQFGSGDPLEPIIAGLVLLLR